MCDCNKPMIKKVEIQLNLMNEYLRALIDYDRKNGTELFGEINLQKHLENNYNEIELTAEDKKELGEDFKENILEYLDSSMIGEGYGE